MQRILNKLRSSSVRQVSAGRRDRLRAQLRKPLVQSLETRRVMAAGAVVFNELLYNPADGQSEFVELHNQLAVDIDISGWSLADGVDYTFPAGTVIGGGEYIVVAEDPTAASFAGVSDVLGPFSGGLSNGGEAVELRNNSDRLMDIVDYDDQGDWPIGADGSGASLSKRSLGTDSELVASWSSSREIGGTPGQVNFSYDTSTPVTAAEAWRFVVINEIEATPTSYRIELHNTGPLPTTTSGYRLIQDGAFGGDVALPSQTIPAGGFVTFDAAALGLTASHGDRLFLIRPDGLGGDVLVDAAVSTGELVGRSSDGGGRFYTPDVATFGSANSFDFEDAIVINEINYNSQVQFAEAAVTAAANVTLIDDFNGDLGDYTQTVILDDNGGGSNTAAFEITAGQLGISTTSYDGIEQYAFIRNGLALAVGEEVRLDIGTPLSGNRNFGLYVGGTEPTTGTREDYISLYAESSNSIRTRGFDGTSEYGILGGTATSAVSTIFIARSGVNEYEVGFYDGLTRELITTRTPNTANSGDFVGFYADARAVGTVGFGDNLTIAAIPDSGSLANPGSALLVGFGDTWRYNESGAELDTSWSQTSHAVGGDWEAGTGPLGFETTTLPIAIATELDDPTTNSVRTYYFENDFTVTATQLAEVSSITLTHLVDDGAVFYLNGVEIERFNIAGTPGTPVPATTSAINAVTDAAVSTSITIPADSLVAGVNRLSVQVHQRTVSSSDIVFGATLLANLGEGGDAAVPFAENDEEWIELYNRSGSVVDVSGWQIDDAVSYDFPAGTSIAAGGYLVVAKDRDAFLVNYPDVSPSIVLGDFSGKLSNSTERISLLDSIGNPADEVVYHDGGQWDGAADGGGSTLELRDSDADNSVGSAWEASDESGRGVWQTITYRGTPANISGTNFPDDFNEFLVGLLDEGEFLLDDVSVVHDPDGAANQLIQNGTFESDDTNPGSNPIGGNVDDWRVLGTHGNHGLTYVVDDPDQPGNQVLRVVATGATNRANNKLETTLKDGGSFHTIQIGDTYEISFRAKWVSGSPQLNTRLYFSHAAKTTILDTPSQHGTPGEVNSNAVANIGPTFTQFDQSVAVPLPNQTVEISATADDPNGVASMRLLYSTGGAFSQVTMIISSDGIARASIPGFANGTIVQFYVEATDGLGAISTFPAEGVDSRALYKVDADAAQNSPTGAPDFRIIMTAADTLRMHDATNVMSNDLFGATIVYDNVVYHNAGVRLRSSMRGRWDDTRLGFTVKFNDDELFRGINKTINIDRSGRGTGSPFASFGQGEITNWHLINAAGDIAGFQNDIVYVVTPQAANTSSAQLVLTGYRNDYLDSAIEDGSDGTLYKFSPVYHPLSTTTATTNSLGSLSVTSNPEDLKFAGDRINGDRVDDVLFSAFQDLGDDPETYRYNYLLENNEDIDNLAPVINLAKTFSLGTSDFNAAIGDVIDMDHFLRTAAMMSLIGSEDNWFNDDNNNLVLYENPESGLIQFFPWDHDWKVSPGTSPLIPSGEISRIVNSSNDSLRTYYSHMDNLVKTVFNNEYLADWTSHYGSLVNGSGEPTQNFGDILSATATRESFARGQLASVTSESTSFTIFTNNGNDFSTADSAATLIGTGNLEIHEFRVAGSSETIRGTWLNNSAWRLNVPIAPGVNAIVLEAIGFDGQVISTDSINITGTGEANAQQDSLRITELYYNPPGGGDPTEFIELTNTGTSTLDVSGATISEGPDVPFVIPAGTTLAAGASLVVAVDPVAFSAAYPDVTVAVLGPYVGSLSNGGETVTLLDSDSAEIMSVNYDDGGLWNSLADGEGVSLELIDTTTSADRLDKFYSWAPSVIYGGTPGAARVQPAGVVINEIIAHTDQGNTPGVDSIELFNPTNADIDISGWWLSDDSDQIQKFQIPAGTTIASGGFVAFDETDFNPTPELPGPNDFALSSSGGEQLLLTQGSGGVPTHLEDTVEFGATFNGVSLGRTPASPTSPARLVPLVNNSFGVGNGAFAFADVVISEIHYHPTDPTIAENDLEFIEIYNKTDTAIDLTNWEIGGDADFAFSSGQSIGAKSTLVAVTFDPADAANADKLAAFVAHYGLAASVELVGPLVGSLSNSYGLVKLQKPDTPDLDGIPRVDVDEVVYDDLAPWASDADGGGQSLNRISPSTLGNFSASWTGDAPTPGEVPSGASVVSVSINQGAETRSEVTSVEVEFDSETVVDASNFELTHVAVDNTLTMVTGFNVTQSNSGGRTTATLTFDGSSASLANVELGLETTLIDGRYELRYRNLGFSDSDARVDDFFRKYGDSDGSGSVGLTDFAAFRSAFGKDYDPGDLSNGFDSGLDADRNGMIGLTDFAAFRSSFGN